MLIPEICFNRRRLFVDLEAPVPSFLMAASCISKEERGLCLIPAGARNVVCSFFLRYSTERHVSKVALLPRSRFSRCFFERRAKGEDACCANTSATVRMWTVSSTLLIDAPGTGDLDLLLRNELDFRIDEFLAGLESAYTYSPLLTSSVVFGRTNFASFCST